ncbi:uncharacterized protein M421DRAFT_424507 [Didymella exigua CBS 183.55]|uniref:HTH CENPB-type domain-containing protein n=1 Tax=Didymella exigua CBS 183.55 TaxID=1150837 RepID=A0A6A5RBA8_9PLEO|nr:uncharacterized protein M421DRAFT_424507 [Didymella exigua CBS 183.55]KAF1924629.1 hypothetical protein M421DRAFT_424507 [Didymella exigua CBS 183.55]
MSQQHHDLLLQHEGRLQLALQAYNTRQFQSHRAAAAAFNVNQRRLSERASNTLFQLNLGDWEWVTVIQSICAAGYATPPFIIYKGRIHISAWYKETDIPHN